MSGTRRDHVLNFVRESGEPVEISAIAEALDLHPNTVRFHLEALLAAGQLERTVADGGRPGRPPQLYAAVRRMDPSGPRNYRVLAEILVANLSGSRRPRQQAVEAGRAWGRGQAALATTRKNAVSALVDVLDDLGFSPARQPSRGKPASIELRHCPFLDLVEDERDVVCPVHLGLMRGALEEWGSDQTVERLDAFVEPDRCVAHLAAVAS